MTSHLFLGAWGLGDLGTGREGPRRALENSRTEELARLAPVCREHNGGVGVLGPHGTPAPPLTVVIGLAAILHFCASVSLLVLPDPQEKAQVCGPGALVAEKTLSIMRVPRMSQDHDLPPRTLRVPHFVGPGCPGEKLSCAMKWRLPGAPPSPCPACHCHLRGCWGLQSGGHWRAGGPRIVPSSCRRPRSERGPEAPTRRLASDPQDGRPGRSPDFAFAIGAPWPADQGRFPFATWAPTRGQEDDSRAGAPARGFFSFF